jgi:Fe-S cluster assembly iron-binding protein IscA
MKITAAAFSRLKLKLRGQPEGTAVRIKLEDGLVTFRPDMKKEGDVVFAHRGQSVLVVAPDTAQRIDARTLDVVETTAGDRLRFVKTV